MPSHDVHGKIAEMLGFDRAQSAIVDELVDDASYVHDLGKRLPKVSLRSKAYEPENFLRMKSSFISKLIKLNKYPDLFYLHHALDLLSLRMASAILIGCDIKSKKNSVIIGVEFDLNVLYNNIKKFVEGRLHSTIIPTYREKELAKMLESNFERIVDLPEFLDWVKMNLVDPRIEEEKVELDQVVKSLYDELYRKKERWTSAEYLAVPPTIQSLPVHAEVVSEGRNRYFIGSLYQKIVKLAAYRSRLFDYMLVYKPYAISIISEKVLRAKKGLGKEVLWFADRNYEPDRIKKKVRDLMSFDLNEIPISVTDAYVDLILKSRSLIDNYVK